MSSETEMSRRDLAVAVAAMAATALGLTATSAVASDQPPPPAHDMSVMPPHWTKNEVIGIHIYPDMTALDMIGPHYFFTNLLGAKTYLVAKTTEPVRSDTGLRLIPDMTFETCPKDLTILLVPGGTVGTLKAMQDDATLDFLAERGSRAGMVTSVCTGSLVLGAAGLLDGYRATSHWITEALLPIFGAIPTEGRIVRDQNRVTCRGVTAGLDFGLALTAELRDDFYAQAVQLLAEYDPAPMFNAGHPDTAPKPVRDLMVSMFVNFTKDMEHAARGVRARRAR